MSVIDRLSEVFRSHGEAEGRESLDQPQREALVDLLVWTMYVDHHLALAEHDKIREQTHDLPWHSVTSLSDYLQASITRTRDVLDTGPAAAQYLDDISQRLGDAGARRHAVRACRELVAADGELSEAEGRHLAMVERHFALADPRS